MTYFFNYFLLSLRLVIVNNSCCNLILCVTHISRVPILENWHNTGCIWLPDARSIQQSIPEWSNNKVYRTISASHRTIVCIRTCLLLALCGIHAWLIARVRGARATEIRPAHVSANLIYFRPDKKLIYREARPVLGNDVFLRPRENRKWRAGLPGCRHGPGHDEILSRDEVKKKEQEALERKKRGGIETSKFRLKGMFESLEIEN